MCFGQIGNLWTLVAPTCSYADTTKLPMNLNSEYCDGADDDAGWDSTWCDGTQCFAELAGWVTTVAVECLFDNPISGDTPAEVYCDTVDTPSGWEDVNCYIDSGLTSLCAGRRGLYYPNWGLYPTCYIQQLEAERTEVSPSAVTDLVCP